MPKSQKPKKKHVPVPRAKLKHHLTSNSLANSIRTYLHLPIMSFEFGGPTARNWRKLGLALYILSVATDNEAHIDRADKIAIDSALLYIDSIADRELRTGQWYAAPEELVALKRGAVAGSNIVGTLEFRLLASAYQTVAKARRDVL